MPPKCPQSAPQVIVDIIMLFLIFHIFHTFTFVRVCTRSHLRAYLKKYEKYAKLEIREQKHAFTWGYPHQIGYEKYENLKTPCLATKTA